MTNLCLSLPYIYSLFLRKHGICSPGHSTQLNQWFSAHCFTLSVLSEISNHNNILTNLVVLKWDLLKLLCFKTRLLLVPLDRFLCTAQMTSGFLVACSNPGWHKYAAENWLVQLDPQCLMKKRHPSFVGNSAFPFLEVYITLDTKTKLFIQVKHFL